MGTITPLEDIQASYTLIRQKEKGKGAVNNFEILNATFWGWSYLEGTCNLATPGGALNVACESSHELTGPIGDQNYSFFVQRSNESVKKYGLTLPMFETKKLRILSAMAFSQKGFGSSHAIETLGENNLRFGFSHNLKDVSYNISKNKVLFENEIRRIQGNINYNYTPGEIRVDGIEGKLSENTTISSNINYIKKGKHTVGASVATSLVGDIAYSLNNAFNNGKSVYRTTVTRFEKGSDERTALLNGFSRADSGVLYSVDIGHNFIKSELDNREITQRIEAGQRDTHWFQAQQRVRKTSGNNEYDIFHTFQYASKYKGVRYNVNASHSKNSVSFGSGANYKSVNANYNFSKPASGESVQSFSVAYNHSLSTKGAFLKEPIKYFNNVSAFIFYDENLNGLYDENEQALTDQEVYFYNQAESDTEEIERTNQNGKIEKRYMESFDIFALSLTKDEQVFLGARDIYQVQANNHINVPLYKKREVTVYVGGDHPEKKLSGSIKCQKTGFSKDLQIDEQIKASIPLHDKCAFIIDPSRNYLFYVQTIPFDEDGEAIASISEVAKGQTGIITRPESAKNARIFNKKTGETIGYAEDGYFYYETRKEDVAIEGYSCFPSINSYDMSEVYFNCKKK